MKEDGRDRGYTNLRGTTPEGLSLNAMWFPSISSRLCAVLGVSSVIIRAHTPTRQSPTPRRGHGAARNPVPAALGSRGRPNSRYPGAAVEPLRRN